MFANVESRNETYYMFRALVVNPRETFLNVDSPATRMHRIQISDASSSHSSCSLWPSTRGEVLAYRITSRRYGACGPESGHPFICDIPASAADLAISCRARELFRASLQHQGGTSQWRPFHRLRQHSFLQHRATFSSVNTSQIASSTPVKYEAKARVPGRPCIDYLQDTLQNGAAPSIGSQVQLPPSPSLARSLSLSLSLSLFCSLSVSLFLPLSLFPCVLLFFANFDNKSSEDQSLPPQLAAQTRSTAQLSDPRPVKITARQTVHIHPPAGTTFGGLTDGACINTATPLENKNQHKDQWSLCSPGPCSAEPAVSYPADLRGTSLGPSQICVSPHVDAYITCHRMPTILGGDSPA